MNVSNTTRWGVLVGMSIFGCGALGEGIQGTPNTKIATPGHNSTQNAVAERCAVGDTVTSYYRGQTELNPIIEGRWAFCGGISPLSRPGVVGIEILPTESRYYFLKDDGVDGRVRAGGFDGQGALRFEANSSSPGGVRLVFGPPANFSTDVEFMSDHSTMSLRPSRFVKIP
jgi:hypothetical protein